MLINMNKKLLFTIVLNLILVFGSFAQAESEDAAAVKQLIQDAFDDIWSSMDSTTISKHHTDDFIILEHGEVWTNATIKGWMKKALTQERTSKRNNSFEYISVEQIDQEHIWVAYHNFANWTEDGKVLGEMSWLESALAVKTDEGWKLKMMHSTRKPRKE